MHEICGEKEKKEIEKAMCARTVVARFGLQFKGINYFNDTGFLQYVQYIHEPAS